MSTFRPDLTIVTLSGPKTLICSTVDSYFASSTETLTVTEDSSSVVTPKRVGLTPASAICFIAALARF